MPYATPSSTTASPPLPTHSLGRPGHRRSYSSERFTDERGPGAFQSLGTLPRRQPSSSSSSAAATSSTASYKPPISVNTQKRFHLKPESSSSSSDEDDDDGPPPPLKLKTPLSPSFGVGVPFPRSSPRNSPRSSPLSSPLPADPNLLSPLSGTGLSSLPINSLSTTNEKYLAPPSRPSPNRTTSSPILLSNGKPLKSSLKSSSSTSNIPATHPTSHSHPHHPHAHHHHSHAHIRARSAPSTPSLATDSTSASTSTGSSPTQSTPATPKNVHFPSLPNDLEHIRIFNRSAKPSSLRRSSDASRGPTGAIIGVACEETETETETDREGWVGGYLRSSVGFGAVTAPASSSSSSSSGFPFPKFPSPPQTPEATPETTFVLDTEGYSVPSTSTSRDQYANIILEKLALSTEQGKGKLALEGSLLVRNIAFEKQVYLRFTLDEWATVSEVTAKYEASLTLPSLTALPGRTLGDIIASASASSSSAPGLGAHGRSFSESALNSRGKTEMINWDRFSFSINLADFARLEERTMWAVGRYVVPGKGEWWDNNGGRNFRVCWKKVVVAKEKKEEKKQEVAEKVVEVKDRERKEGRSLSAPAAPVVVPNVTTTAPSPPPPKTTFATATATAPTHSPPTSPTSREQTTAALTAATSARLSKFSLKNYVAPGSPAAVRSRSGSLSSLTSPSTPSSTSAPSTEVVEKKVEEKEKPEPKTDEPAPEPEPLVMKRENKPSFSGMGIGLYWPWGSNSSASSTSTNNSTEKQVKAGGSASVVVVPSPKASPTPKAEDRKEFFPVPVPVPGLEKDGSNASSTSGSSESLDSLMSSSFSTTTYMPRLNVKELEYGYHPGAFNGLTDGDLGVYNAYDGGFLHTTLQVEPVKDVPSTQSQWSPEDDSEDAEADITETEVETETERTPKLSPLANSNSDSPVPSPPSFSSSVTSSITSTASSSPVLMSPSVLPFSPRAGTDDSLYKAFVKQWCFGGSGAGAGAGVSVEVGR
ncbi:hypothetical protein VNI00_004554 [Paramarasmius palmivorus]|uniref:CBM21 domain-containing protein n=1 Tax=Paramarasmius palmivorus TaxID=297713 RepID=A0AAW0DHV7_9AGAR